MFLSLSKPLNPCINAFSLVNNSLLLSPAPTTGEIFRRKTIVEMALSQLGASIRGALQKMSGATSIDEKGLEDCLIEIKDALLQYGAEVKIVDDMVANIKNTVNLDDSGPNLLKVSNLVQVL